MELEGKSPGWSTDELAGFDALLHTWFCAIPRFVLGSCAMTALQVGEVGPCLMFQRRSSQKIPETFRKY